MIACNDYILLECCIYRIVKKHFSSHEAYAAVNDLFHEVTYQTSIGQLLDLTTAPIGHVDLSRCQPKSQPPTAYLVIFIIASFVRVPSWSLFPVLP